MEFFGILTEQSLENARRIAAKNVDFFLHFLNSSVIKIVSQTLVNFGICNFFHICICVCGELYIPQGGEFSV